MKIQNWFPATILIVAIGCISWGYTGHRTIGLITEHYLDPQAKTAIKDLLGDTTIAEACTWADDARREAPFAETANWHFLNLPLGLSYGQLTTYLDTTRVINVYSALLTAEKNLTDKNLSRQQKIHSLKFLMHFVGDLHQPMHVSRAEDKGGNTIQLNFQDKGTNLHSLWDTRLLESKGLKYVQLAEQYKQVESIKVKQWQSEPVTQWVWESYQISSKLYAEVDTMNRRIVDSVYVQKHLPTVTLRLQQSAIRLAGLLNRIYKNSDQ